LMAAHICEMPEQKSQRLICMVGYAVLTVPIDAGIVIRSTLTSSLQLALVP